MNSWGIAVLIGLMPAMIIVGALFMAPLLSYYGG
jgi:hypothetical protein